MLRRALTQVFCRSPATPHTVLPWALLALALTVGAPGAGGARAQDAAAPVFELPVNCAVGHICHVQNYFDTDPAAGASDYTCGVLTYDGHNGIDIRVPNLVWMARGVTVIAAAAGRVRGVRDGVKDVNIKVAGAEAVRGRECANGVVIDPSRRLGNPILPHDGRQHRRRGGDRGAHRRAARADRPVGASRNSLTSIFRCACAARRSTR